jgi:hypothetical protein
MADGGLFEEVFDGSRGFQKQDQNIRIACNQTD